MGLLRKLRQHVRHPASLPAPPHPSAPPQRAPASPLPATAPASAPPAQSPEPESAAAASQHVHRPEPMAAAAAAAAAATGPGTPPRPPPVPPAPLPSLADPQPLAHSDSSPSSVEDWRSIEQGEPDVPRGAQHSPPPAAQLPPPIASEQQPAPVRDEAGKQHPAALGYPPLGGSHHHTGSATLLPHSSDPPHPVAGTTAPPPASTEARPAPALPPAPAPTLAPSEDGRQAGAPETPSTTTNTKSDTNTNTNPAAAPWLTGGDAGMEFTSSEASLRPPGSHCRSNPTGTGVGTATHTTDSHGWTTPSSMVTSSTMATQMSAPRAAPATPDGGGGGGLAALLDFEFGAGPARDLAASLSVPTRAVATRPAVAGARPGPGPGPDVGPGPGPGTAPSARQRSRTAPPRAVRALALAPQRQPQLQPPTYLSPTPKVAASAPQLAELPAVQPLEELLGTWTSS